MPSLLPQSVLIVDDDEGDFIILEAMLEEIGPFRAEWASTSEAGLEGMLAGRHDLVFVDFNLDHLDGVGLLQKARAQGFHSPTIILTGANDPDIELAGARAGASDFLVKGRLSPRDVERSIRFALSQHRLERERVRRTEAEASVRLKDEFVASVAHELRGPIHAIRLASQLVLDHGAPEGLARPLELLGSSVAKLGRLVEDILDTARAQNGELVLLLDDVDLASTTVAALHYHELRAREAGVTLRVETEPITVLGDATRLTQVIDNLVSNALTHTPRGGEVVVSVGPVGEEFARIEVRDSGPGVPEGSEKLIFDAYGQHRGKGHRGAGLGLGLYLVRLITTAHGGSVRVRNDGGAVFTVMLPKRPVEDDIEPPPSDQPST